MMILDFNETSKKSFLFAYPSVLNLVHLSRALPPTYLMNNDNDPETDVAALLPQKDYLPRGIDLPKSLVIPSRDDDTTYLLSKLSDQELISLLNDKAKEKFELKDVVKVSTNFKNEPNFFRDSYKSLKKETKSKEPVPQVQSQNPMAAYFRLDDKEVQPFNFKANADPNYLALQKINNLLYSRPSNQDYTGVDSDIKKELLFDMLVAQLKKLCCQSSQPKQKGMEQPLKALLDKVPPNKSMNKNNLPYKYQVAHEHMFLIINDNINEEESDDDLITVDPESLSQNSSVLLLGPITTPLAENQLKLVMTRITNELSKPDYLPLFQQIAEGTLSESNTRLVKSLVKGPETRRYIKPHRCNHQSKLTKIYNGPKWIICTGYLNLNTPSLYD